MANICPEPACTNDWDDLTGDLCPELFDAGMSAMILLKCGVERADLVTGVAPNEVLDPALMAALVAAGNAKRIPSVEITMDPPSEVTGKTFDPCNPEAAINYDRTFTINDPNVTEARRKFWDSVKATNSFATGGMLVYECGADRWTYVEKRVYISGGRQSGATNAESQFAVYVAKWRDKNDPEIFPAADLMVDP